MRIAQLALHIDSNTKWAKGLIHPAPKPRPSPAERKPFAHAILKACAGTDLGKARLSNLVLLDKLRQETLEANLIISLKANRNGAPSSLLFV